MPWIMPGLAVHQVEYAAPLPQTMPTVWCPKPAGKADWSALNQYCSTARDSVVYR